MECEKTLIKKAILGNWKLVELGTNDNMSKADTSLYIKFLPNGEFQGYNPCTGISGYEEGVYQVNAKSLYGENWICNYSIDNDNLTLSNVRGPLYVLPVYMYIYKRIK
jgi:hypothetical protein